MCPPHVARALEICQATCERMCFYSRIGQSMGDDDGVFDGRLPKNQNQQHNNQPQQREYNGEATTMVTATTKIKWKRWQ